MAEALKTLVILSSSPFEGTRARDAIEAAMTCAVFGQRVSFLLLAEGVRCLNVRTDGTGLRNIPAMIEALPLYDVASVAASATCLAERSGVAPESVQLLDTEAVTEWIQHHDKHLCF